MTNHFDLNQTISSDVTALYFSQVRLRRDILRNEKWELLGGGGYGLHQAVWRLFPDSKRNQRRDFIYRDLDNGRIPGFYVLSQRIPEDREELWEINHKPYAPRFVSGSRFAFSIRANPRVSRMLLQSNSKTPPKHDIFMDAKRIFREEHNGQNPVGTEWQNLIQNTGKKWLNRQGERLGFFVEFGYVNSYRKERLNKSGKQISYGTADFEGVLRVQNPEIFLKALFEGIGGSKSFGCGLLLIRRV